jgi:hypothetical protein
MTVGKQTRSDYAAPARARAPDPSPTLAPGRRTLVEMEGHPQGATVLARGTEELRPATVHDSAARPSIAPATSGTLDPDTEVTLIGLLGQRVAADDVRGIQARLARLLAAFRAVPQSGRAALRGRLLFGDPRDPLGFAFHASLHHATRARILAALSGSIIPPAAHDAMTPEGFAAHLPADALRVEPSPLVIHPRFAPHVTARVLLTSEYGPSVDGPSVRAVLRLYDDHEAERATERIAWPAAKQASDAATFTLDRPGRYRVECELIESGLVIAQRRGEIEVTSPATELLMQAGLRAAASARASGAGRIGAAIAAGLEALRAGSAGDLTAAAQMSPEQRRDAHRRIGAQMARDLDPTARAQLADDRALLEYTETSAGRAPAALDRPTPPLPDQITLAGMDRASVDVSADPVFLRRWIEQTYLASGLAGVDALPAVITERAADDRAIMGDPSRHAFAIERVLPALHHQIEILKAEIEAFEHQFAATVTQIASDTLDQSERVARAELARYGIDVRTTTRTSHGPDDLPRMSTQRVATTSVGGGDNPAARDLARAGAELAANQREIDRMRTRVGELRDVERYREHIEPGAGAGAGAEPTPAVDPGVIAGAPDAAHLPQVLASLERLILQADHAHQARIGEQTEKHPLLASYKRTDGDRVRMDVEALDRLRGDGRAAAIYERIAPVLSNIAATRAALGGSLNVWKEPRIVQLARAQLYAAPGSLRGAIVEHKVSEEHEGSWSQWAIMAITFGLAILTAIPTGGSSLAAGVVIAADVAGAVADVYLVVDHLRAYRLDAAKAGTDLDAQARAISVETPSLFWLALDLVATGVGLSAAAKTFGTVAKDLVKAEQLAASGARLSAEDADIAVARIHQLARDGKMSADAAERAEAKIHLVADSDVTSRGAHAAEVTERGPHPAGHGTETEGHAAHMRRDLRARVSPENLAQLEQRLGVPIVVDDTLSNGVELQYATKRGLLGVGTDIEPTAMRIGRDALIEDVLAHRATIARVTRYNGVVGKLRGLWDRLVVKTEGSNPFRPGELGWEAFEEIRKIDELIAMRRARWNPRTLDARTLDDEIAFLEGRRAYHEEIIRSAQETGAIRETGHLDAPDIGRVTDEAKAKGYRLPSTRQGANPDWYYYRNSRTAPGEYELARKPSAPVGTEQYRAVTKEGRFERLEHGDTPRPRTLIPGEWTDQQVIEHLWTDDSFAAFARLLERERLATREEINAAIVAKSANRAKLGSLVDDTVRGNVKDVFRSRLVEKLTDPALDAQASWRRMREMLDGLDSGDRGNLVELWYQARYAKKAEHHVAARVSRSDDKAGQVGDKAGQVEDRMIDLVDGERAIEVKDVSGPIDQDQYRAYVDMLTEPHDTMGANGPIIIKRLRYVFTRPEGARANLAFFAKQFRDDQGLFGQLSIQVFDGQGVAHIVTSTNDAEALLKYLGGAL